jgi:hypothetical protein
MARTALPIQVLNRDGLDPVYSAATVDGFAVDLRRDGVVIHVKNDSASPIDVTFVTAGVVDGMNLPDKVATIPASGSRFFGNFYSMGFYIQADADTGLAKAVQINFSAITSVSAAAMRG